MREGEYVIRGGLVVKKDLTKFISSAILANVNE